NPSATGTSRTRNSSPGGHWPCGWPFGEHGPGNHVSNTSGSAVAGDSAAEAEPAGEPGAQPCVHASNSSGNAGRSNRWFIIVPLFYGFQPSHNLARPTSRVAAEKREKTRNTAASLAPK